MSAYCFFPLPEIIDVCGEMGSDVGKSCILIGDRTTCKSSLAFQSAVTLASEGEQVFYICPQAPTSKPRPVNGMLSADPMLCRHIKMVYISGTREFVDYFSGFHKQNCFPLAFIIDDFDFYIQHLISETDIEHSFASLSAMLVDTVGFVMRKREQPCHLLVTMSNSKQLRTILPICERYYKNVWISSFSHAKEAPTSLRRFYMTNTRNPPVRIYYHVDGDVIFFDKLTRLTNADGGQPSYIDTIK